MVYQLSNAPKLRLDTPSNSAFFLPAFSTVGLLNNSGVGGSERLLGHGFWDGTIAS
jgi:hypothetical protein